MSNRAHFTHTRFADADGTNVCYGYRVSDDEMMTYGDMWEEYEELDDLAFLRKVLDICDHQVDALVADMRSMQKGAFINGCWYDYDDIADLLDADDPPGTCLYCGGSCPNEADDSPNLCDGYAGDIDNLYTNTGGVDSDA